MTVVGWLNGGVEELQRSCLLENINQYVSASMLMKRIAYGMSNGSTSSGMWCYVLQKSCYLLDWILIRYLIPEIFLDESLGNEEEQES